MTQSLILPVMVIIATCFSFTIATSSPDDPTLPEVIPWIKGNRTEIEHEISIVSEFAHTSDASLRANVSTLTNDSETLRQQVSSVSILANTLRTDFVSFKDQTGAKLSSLEAGEELASSRLDSINATLKQAVLNIGYVEEEAVVLKTRIDNNHAEIKQDVVDFDAKTSQIIRDLNATNVELKKQVTALTTMINELRASIKTQCFSTKTSHSMSTINDESDICSTSPQPGDESLSALSIVFIVLAGLVGGGLILMTVICCRRRRQRKLEPLLGEDELHQFEPSAINSLN